MCGLSAPASQSGGHVTRSRSHYELIRKVRVKVKVNVDLYSALS